MRGSAAVFLLLGCGPGPEDPPPEPLEIGVNEGGTFRPLADGDPMLVSMGANGLNMVQPCLRNPRIDPRAPIPDVTLAVGPLLAVDLKGERVDMRDDGIGLVLWDLRVAFDQGIDVCCFVCQEGLVTAAIRDARGRRFEGTVRVFLERGGGCPDPCGCCIEQGLCPAGAEVQSCSSLEEYCGDCEPYIAETCPDCLPPPVCR